MSVLSSAIAAAFVSGLLGSFGHCAAMCGPLVGSLSLAAGAGGARRSLAGQLAYHAGRITTYGAVGAAMGLTGSFLNVAGRLAGVQQAVAVGQQLGAGHFRIFDWTRALRSFTGWSAE